MVYQTNNIQLKHLHGVVYRVDITEVVLDEFLDINRILIKEARLLGHDYKNGRQLKDLEILAELQHLGAATCLIDFTYNAHIALWFACQPCSGGSGPPDGKVGAVLNEPDAIEEITPEMLEVRDLVSFFNAPSQKLWQPQLFDGNRGT